MNGFSFLRFALDLACPEIERANSAVSLLEQGTPMSDTAFELGYFDQAHLTNSLKRFIGKRPRKSLGKARLDSLRFFQDSVLLLHYDCGRDGERQKENIMRKVVVTEFMSLDGIMEEPRWTFKYWNDEIAKFKGEESSASDTLLLGRVTYQGFAAAWPQSKDEGADYFNSVRKYVVSETLEEPLEWNNSTLIKDNIVEQITNLKQQDGKDIAVHGSATLVQTLMQHDLVDRYRLLVYPVVVGKGKRLFKEGIPATLKLLESQSFSSGVVALVYEPDRK